MSGNKAILFLTMAFLLIIYTAPGTLNAQIPQMGIYFDDGGMTYRPQTAYEQFDAHLYIQSDNYMVTAVEYQLLTPQDPFHSLVVLINTSYPEYATLYIGDPLIGHSVAFWPPLAYDGPYLVCSMRFFTLLDLCEENFDFPLVIGPHPDTGELRGAYYPDQELFDIIGLTSFLCPSHWPPRLETVYSNGTSLVEVEFDNCVVPPWGNPFEENFILYNRDDVTDTIAVAEVLPGEYSSRWTLVLEDTMTIGEYYILEAHDICCDCMGCADSWKEFYCDGVIATALQSFAASLAGDAIEVRWHLSSVDGNIDFLVSRSESEEDYLPLSSSGIVRNGMEYVYRDESVEPGKVYSYMVSYIDGEEPRILFETGSIEVPSSVVRLDQNYPNPFNPVTMISFYLPEGADTRLVVCDVTGRTVRTLKNSWMEAGPYCVEWDGFDDAGLPAASGIYFYYLRSGKGIISRKMVLLR